MIAWLICLVIGHVTDGPLERRGKTRQCARCLRWVSR